MPRPPRSFSLLLALLLAPPAPAAERKPAASPRPGGVPVARVSFVGEALDWSEPGRDWQRAKEEFRMKTGDRVRTGPDTVARVEFPWMAVTTAPSTTLAVPEGFILSTVLEQGRAEIEAPGGDIIKLRTEEAQVRGGGRVVVRREPGETLVSVLEGSFRVEAAGKAVTLARGEGAVVRRAQAPDTVKLSAPPVQVSPGADPVYVLRGSRAQFSWSPPGTSQHVQVLGVDSDAVLMEADVGAPPQSITVPWLGTYRWRVAMRDERGLEGMPSAPGLVCVVEK